MKPNVNVNVGGPQKSPSTYTEVVLKGNLPFSSQVTEENKRYVIKWNFDLNGETVTIPEDCILDFNGGSINNGTIIGQDTIVYSLTPSALNITQQGTFIFKNGGNLTNEEDLTIENNLIKFADRAYNSQAPNGMGYVILRKDKTFAEQVTETNTIYEIRYDFTLTDDVTIPANCVLEFDGGSLSGAHTITGVNTGINAGLVKVFNSNVTLSGTWNIEEAYPEWFGADNTGSLDSAQAINKALVLSILTDTSLVLHGTLTVNSSIVISKRVTIEGNMSSLITSNSNLDCFILIDNVGKSYETYGDGNNIVIKNIRFNNGNISGASGIKFIGSSVTDNYLKRLVFNDFKNPCILFGGSGVFDTYSVYAHNIHWETIITSGCCSIINRLPDSSPVYIYGGVIKDIHFEGVHTNDLDGYTDIMDLRDFLNIDISDVIMEGVNNSDNKTSCFKTSGYRCSFRNIYFEMKGNAPVNSFHCSLMQRNIVHFDNLYGNIPAPIYLFQVNAIISQSAAMNLRNTILNVNADNLIDAASRFCSLTFESIYINDTWRVTDNSRVLPSSINYKGVIVNASTYLNVNSNEPFLKLDLSKLVVGTSGDYGAKVYLLEDTGYTDSTAVSYGTDIRYGNTITISPMDNSIDNFLHCKLRVSYAAVGFEVGDRLTIVVTLKPINTPHFQKWENASEALVCYPSHNKVKNELYTMIIGDFMWGSGAVMTLPFENSIPSSETASEKQAYTIYDISIFKGHNYGQCPSKINTEPKNIY